MSYWGSPALDISYLLFTSSSKDITTENLSDLLIFYYEKLSQSFDQLEIIQERRLSKDNFLHEFYSKGIFGAAYCLFTIPMRLIETPSTDAVMKFLDSSENGENFRRKIYAQPDVKALIGKVLKFCNQNGIFG